MDPMVGLGHRSKHCSGRFAYAISTQKIILFQLNQKLKSQQSNLLYPKQLSARQTLKRKRTNQGKKI